VHELALAGALLDALRDSADERGIRRIGRVRVVMGALSCADPRALHFAFDVLKTQDDRTEAAQLEIEVEPARARCRHCRHEFTASWWQYRCPQCQQFGVELEGSDEIRLDWYEGE